MIPDWDGRTPYPADQGEDNARELGSGPLPPLIPEAPDPTLCLSASPSGESLTITAGAPIFRAAKLEDVLAWRWWVNGRPFQPEGRPLGPIRRMGAVPSPTDTARLHLDFDPALLGARSGDRVGVQLLYFEGGWAGGELNGFQKPYWDDDPPRPRMTHRVELMVP